MKTKQAILIPLFLLLFFGSVTNGSFGLKLERKFHQGLGEEVIFGTYEVMENRSVRKGARIRLNFIILPASAPNPAPDPIFVFQGGPGMGAASFPIGFALYCDKARWEREVVFLDQRGTGLSNPLHCERIGDPNLAQTYLQDMFPEDYVKKCRKKLQKKANLRYYHTMMSLADTDELREALGYEQINLMGGSYGSYAALQYMKYYPERVRSSVLFSIALPHLLYPANLAQDTQNALERLFTDCAADPDCAADYPDLPQRLDQILNRLKQGPVTVNIINPINGQPETVSFTHNNFIHGLRSMLYSNSASRWIPAFIHWASNGHYAPIAEYTADYLYGINQDLMDGLLLCVTCTETIPFIDFDVARAQAQGTMMGTYRLDQQERACELWVRGRIPDGFNDPFYSDIPTLLANGENDPTTPQINGHILSGYLANSRYIVVPNAGHGVGNVMENCLDDIIALFYEQASVANIDSSCVNTYTRPPFVSWRDYSESKVFNFREELKPLLHTFPGLPFHPPVKKLKK